jgi:hypothetical protein
MTGLLLWKVERTSEQVSLVAREVDRREIPRADSLTSPARRADI